ncbi:MAG: hypothetical protein AAF658_02470, partial [Myxococcota bacterium]
MRPSRDENGVAVVATGQVTLAITAADAAGNTSLCDAGATPPCESEGLTVSVDTTLPTLPAVSTSGSIIHYRRPWTGDLAELESEVVGVAGAVDPEAFVELYIEAGDDGTGVAIDSTTAAMDGSFRFDVPVEEEAQLFLASVNAVGTRSDIVRIRDGQWRAELTGRTFLNSSQNPHSAFRAERDMDALLSQRRRELFDNEYEGLETGATVSTSAQWLEPEFDDDVVFARSARAAAYDPIRGAAWIFGGRDIEGRVLDDLIVYDGTTFRGITPLGERPPGVDGAQLTYVGSLDALVLSGGLKEDDQTTDAVWVYFPSANVWVLGESLPSPRWLHAIAWDSVEDRLLLTAGCADSGCRINDIDPPDPVLDDAWLFDLDSEVWTATATLPAAPGNPSGVYAHSLHYDPALRVFYAYGGVDTPAGGQLPSFGGDADLSIPPSVFARVFDGSAWTTVNVGGATTVRSGATFDPETSRLLVYGGRSATAVDRIVTFDGSTTGTLALDDPNGFAQLRIDPFVYLDPATGELLILGGIEWTDQTVDSPGDAISDAAGSVLRVPVTANGEIRQISGDERVFPIAARSGPAVSYDTFRGRVVMLGGYDSIASPFGADSVYEWTGQGWTELLTTNFPNVRVEFGSYYDSCRGGLVVHKGRPAGEVVQGPLGNFSAFADTWILPDGTNTWQELVLERQNGLGTVSPSPSVMRFSFDMPFAPNGCSGEQRLLIAGGFNQEDLAQVTTGFFGGILIPDSISFEPDPTAIVDTTAEPICFGCADLARGRIGFAYDESSQLFVGFGGSVNNTG